MRMTRSLVGGLLVLGIVAAPAAPGAQRAGLSGGAWVAISAERNGAPADDVVGHRLLLADKTFRVEREGTKLYAGTYTIDPAHTPARIDFRLTEGAQRGKTWRGIYRLEGDALTTCDNAPDLAKPRPTAFAAPPGSGYVLIVFRRERR